MGDHELEFEGMADDVDVAAWLRAEDEANIRWLLAAVFEHRPVTPDEP